MPKTKLFTFKRVGLFAAGRSLRGLSNKQTAAGTWDQLDPCVYCGGPADTREHITPRSQGGPNNWPNIARACTSCNRKRGTTPLLVFLLRQSA